MITSVTIHLQTDHLQLYVDITRHIIIFKMFLGVTRVTRYKQTKCGTSSTFAWVNVDHITNAER